MAFLQSELPPSTAPVQPSRESVRRVMPAPVPQRRQRSKLAVRLALGLIAATLFATPGYLAARATGSIAIGILVADFAFLLVVAGWSSVAGERRR